MQYWIGVLTIVGIYMIAVLGVSILCGFTGMFSMGHAGFMAIGGYVSALLTKNCGMPIFVGILGGMLAASLVGYLISYPTLRLRDDYFIIVTLGIGEAIKLIIQNTESITGGARGFSDVPSGSNVFVVWGVVILTVIGLRSFINSKHGRNCIAVREDEIAARSVGVNIFKYKMEAMIISCALCGCAGAFLAHYMHFLHPNMFTMAKSDELIIVVILGGRGSLTGTILAGLLLLPLPELPEYSESELESRIIDHLQQFLLELGTGFAFVGRQVRFTFDEEHFMVDLVFYNRLLRCFVLFDLKIGELKHQDIGQMQMYVHYYDRKMKLPEENPTIGIILCKDKNNAVVEMTLPEDNSQIFASKYETVLPSKEDLQRLLEEQQN